MSVARLLVICLAVLLAGATQAQERWTLVVPGSANPYLSGAPHGTRAGNDAAPAQSPVVLEGLAGGLILLTFEVTGGASYTGGFHRFEPDGGDPWAHGAGARNGMSSITAPASSLLGVFAAEEVSATAPDRDLDFTTSAARDFTRLTPDLQQVFFIGDGRSALGAVQEFVVPKGATRLFLGTMDAYGWYDNTGEYTVTVTSRPLD